MDNEPMEGIFRLLSFLFKVETRVAIYIIIYIDNSSSKDDSLAFIKLLMLYDGIVKVIMTMLPFNSYN